MAAGRKLRSNGQGHITYAKRYGRTLLVKCAAAAGVGLHVYKTARF